MCRIAPVTRRGAALAFRGPKMDIMGVTVNDPWGGILESRGGASLPQGRSPPCPGTTHGSLCHAQAWQQRMSV